jgi:hypothetical protein
MKRNVLKALLIASVLLLAILIGTFGFLNNFNFDELTEPLILLPTMFIDYARAFLTSFDLSGMSNLLIVGGTAFGVLVGLLAMIRGFVVRRPLSGILALVAVTDLFALGVSLIIINPDLPRGRFIWVLVDGISSDLIGTLFLGGALGLIFLALFLTFILGFTAKRRVRVSVKVQSGPKIALSPTVQPTLQPATVTPNSPSSSDTLSELVKVVMQEELNQMRNTQQIYPNQGSNQPNQSNPYASNPYATNVDVQLVRRIVAEEIAKYQGQFLTRPEAQTLIAQEMMMIKSQLKIK